MSTRTAAALVALTLLLASCLDNPADHVLACTGPDWATNPQCQKG